VVVVEADAELAALAADSARLAPHAPTLDEVVEAAGRQRLAAYYLYCALISGLMGDDALPPWRWPQQLAEPMDRLGLRPFAPRSEQGLDTELTASEQAVRRSPGRHFAFAQLTADLINRGAFGPCSGDVNSVRVAESTDRDGYDLELLADGKVLGKCKAEDHWELVAQQLASAPHGDDPLATPESGLEFAKKTGNWLKEHGISHGISKGTYLAVGVYPLGTTVGVGTRLVRSRIQTGRREADALHRLGQVLSRLHADADGELREERADRGR
jgi:hypothetical protein